ncbi:MAG: hypothetical protein BWY89_01433 [Bacteroidetes bacterium ADurb.BinA012]|nr:MAG: hypothetical protein BWY89_01433 [Bacteroidetes bacterium ADurb.BinA012]
MTFASGTDAIVMGRLFIDISNANGNCLNAVLAKNSLTFRL